MNGLFAFTYISPKEIMVGFMFKFNVYWLFTPKRFLYNNKLSFEITKSQERVIENI
jgi:hypothetical protein